MKPGDIVQPGLGLRAVVLVSAATICAAIANRVLPHRIPWRGDWEHRLESKARAAEIPVIDVAGARARVEGGADLVLDARPLADFDRGHLPGALSVPQREMSSSVEAIQSVLTPEQPLLVYCSEPACDESLLLAVYLRELGFTNLVLFAGGYQAWEAAGLPVEGGGQGP